MKEDIKNLEEIINLCKEEINNNNKNATATLDLEDLKSLKNVLDSYKQLEEKNKKFYEGEIFTAKQLKNIEQNQKKYFINKQVVKEKIEEIKLRLKDDCLALHEFQRLAKIDVLEELLREEYGR